MSRLACPNGPRKAVPIVEMFSHSNVCNRRRRRNLRHYSANDRRTVCSVDCRITCRYRGRTPYRVDIRRSSMARIAAPRAWWLRPGAARAESDVRRHARQLHVRLHRGHAVITVFTCGAVLLFSFALPLAQFMRKGRRTIRVAWIVRG
jgi:hypothetical protein